MTKKVYRVIRLPKTRNRFRRIYVPSKQYKKALRSVVPDLQLKSDELDVSDSAFAFRLGRNCVMHALQHVGYRYTLSLDLEDFFDGITVDMVASHLSEETIELCFIDGSPRQGLPSSPAISNIAMAATDSRITESLHSTLNDSFRYTRYADDLTISFNKRSSNHCVYRVVTNLVSEIGLEINERKTKFQDSRRGLRLITGVGVDSHGVRVPRKVRRKIRAAKHQENRSSELGLSEWAKLKLPRRLARADESGHLEWQEAKQRESRVLIFRLESPLMAERIGALPAGGQANNASSTLSTLLTESDLNYLAKLHQPIKFCIYSRYESSLISATIEEKFPSFRWDCIVPLRRQDSFKEQRRLLVKEIMRLGAEAPSSWIFLGASMLDTKLANGIGAWSFVVTGKDKYTDIEELTRKEYRASGSPDGLLLPDIELIGQAIEKPTSFLPQLERSLEKRPEELAQIGDIRPVHRAVETAEGEVSDAHVLVLGRYFTKHPIHLRKHQQHTLSQVLLEAKDSGVYPDEVASALRSVLFRICKSGDFLVTTIPSRHGRPKRMERLLGIVEQDFHRSAGLWAEVEFSNDVFVFKNNDKPLSASRLTRAERIASVFGSLDLDSARDFSGKTVVVVDDVLTSGATLLKAKSLIQSKSADHVILLAMAETVRG